MYSLSVCSVIILKTYAVSTYKKEEDEFCTSPAMEDTPLAGVNTVTECENQIDHSYTPAFIILRHSCHAGSMLEVPKNYERNYSLIFLY